MLTNSLTFFDHTRLQTCHGINRVRISERFSVANVKSQNCLERQQGEGRRLREPSILPPYLQIQVFLHNHVSSLVDIHSFFFSLSYPLALTRTHTSSKKFRFSPHTATSPVYWCTCISGSWKRAEMWSSTTPWCLR